LQCADVNVDAEDLMLQHIADQFTRIWLIAATLRQRFDESAVRIMRPRLPTVFFRRREGAMA
jgi:hypothetical protein